MNLPDSLSAYFHPIFILNYFPIEKGGEPREPPTANLESLEALVEDDVLYLLDAALWSLIFCNLSSILFTNYDCSAARRRLGVDVFLLPPPVTELQWGAAIRGRRMDGGPPG